MQWPTIYWLPAICQALGLADGQRQGRCLPTRSLWSRGRAAWQLPRNPNRILGGCSRSVCWLNPGQLFCTNRSLLSPWLHKGSRTWRAATEQGSLTLPPTNQVLFKGVPAPFKSMPSATSFFPQIINCPHLTTGGPSGIKQASKKVILQCF